MSSADISTLRHYAVGLQMAARKEDAASAWLDLGKSLQAHSRFEEARDAYNHALTCKSDCLGALVELGAVHLRLGEPSEAAQLLQRAIDLEPEHGAAHVLLSRAYHLLGDPVQGLREFAWLTHPNTVSRRGFTQPMWDGAMDRTRTILLWMRTGSGLGDAIQYLRYAPLVKARCGTVIVECHEELVELAARMPGVDVAIARGTTLPPFDTHAPLPRLPIVFQGDPWPLPPTLPYLSVRAEVRDRWREWLGPDRCVNIGLVWTGDARRPDASIRFSTLASFAAFGRIPGIRLFSLQVGPGANELDAPTGGLHITRPPIDLRTPLEESAGLVLNLDHVVTVDTMAVHLAGALGKPVWVLLPFAADWRWQQGDTTPWYPTARLFRQTKAGDWDDVAQRAAEALEAHLASRR